MPLCPGQLTIGSQDEDEAAGRLSPAFLRADHQRAIAIADDLGRDPQIRAARTAWPNLPRHAKLSIISRIVTVQSEHLGIPAPDLIAAETLIADGVAEAAHFDPVDGKLHLQESAISDFPTAVTVAVGGNAFNYALHLLRAFARGQISPDSADYKQAAAFSAQYALPSRREDSMTSSRQPPTEDYAWRTGRGTAKQILRALSAAARAP